MPYPTHARPDDSPSAGQVVDQWSPQEGRYGVAVRDIFSDAGWTPAEPVRARDWRDTGEDARWSETSFD